MRLHQYRSAELGTVLVVDDEFGLAKLLGEILSDEGHGVRIAMNGKEAFDQALAERPDLILSDVMMPVMDGPALMQALKDNAELADVPVLLMSSLPDSQVALRCTGHVGFLRKPFNIEALVAIVAAHLTPPSAQH